MIYTVRAIIKGALKAFFWVLLTAILLAVSFGALMVISGNSTDSIEKEEVASPVATMEYLKPTKEHHAGSVIRYTYRYGTLTIDRGFPGARNLQHHRLFAEIYTAWPEFGKRKNYHDSDEDDRLRIIFEINKHKAAIFRDVYSQVSSDLNPYNTEDNRFSGFTGYKRDNGWLYIAKSSDLVMPQGTPVAILCSDDDFHTASPGRKVGKCRYSFIFDEDLRAQIRFNKPLMDDFEQVHKDLLKFMSSVRESK